LVKGADYTLTNFHKLGIETIRHTPRYEEEGIGREGGGEGKGEGEGEDEDEGENERARERRGRR
jgi:hypothetical protein